MAKKNDKETLVSPKGVVGPYPAIDRIDYGSDDYPDPAGSYKCEVHLDKKDKGVKELMKRFDAFTPEIEAAARALEKKTLKEKGKKIEVSINPMYREVYDEEGEETGVIAIKAKTKASGKNRKTGEEWNRKLPIRDSKGNLIKGKLGIATGSVVKMAATIGDVYATPTAGAGRTLYLDSVMLFELQQFGGSNPFSEEDYEDDGYEFDASDVQEETSSEDNANDDEDEDDVPAFAS